jgi:hypothetical protein
VALGVYSASNKNAYQKMFQGSRVWSECKADNLTAIYDPAVQTVWGHLRHNPLGLHGLLQRKHYFTQHNMTQSRKQKNEWKCSLLFSLISWRGRNEEGGEVRQSCHTFPTWSARVERKEIPMAWVHDRTVPAERPPLIDEVSSNCLRIQGTTWSAWRILTAVFSTF